MVKGYTAIKSRKKMAKGVTRLMEDLTDNNATEDNNKGEMEIDSDSTSEAEETQDDASASDDQQPAEDDMESMMDMYEESFKRFAEGEVVTGHIISIDKDHVLVDIGYKSEGQIKINEFMDDSGSIQANIDDPVEVMVEWWDDENEVVVLSKEKATKVKVWEEIKKAHDADETVEGTIVNRVKGGFSVDIGVQAFLPGSQADLRPIRNLDDMVGNAYEFKILKYNRKRSNIVLSRRAILEKEREAKRAETLSSIEIKRVGELIGETKNAEVGKNLSTLLDNLVDQRKELLENRTPKLLALKSLEL